MILNTAGELLADDKRQRGEKPTSVFPKRKERDQFKHLFDVVLAIPLLQIIPEELPNRGEKLLPTYPSECRLLFEEETYPARSGLRVSHNL